MTAFNSAVRRPVVRRYTHIYAPLRVACLVCLSLGADIDLLEHAIANGRLPEQQDSLWWSRGEVG